MEGEIPVKVLVADPISDEGLVLFNEEPEISADVKTGLKEEEILPIINEYDALIVRSQTQVTEAIIKAGTKLKVIGRAGVGLDNIDVPAATRQGIIVMNVPGGNTISTAEHSMAMLLSMTRNIPQAFASLKAGKWDRKTFTGAELMRKKLGVIGLGRIGQEVAKRAEAFGMEIMGFDPFVTVERAEQLGVKLFELDEIIAKADYITVHVPLTKETRGMFGEKQFAMMKKGIRLINCARGGIYDEKALYENLKSGKVAAAAFDVFDPEPPSMDNPLFSLNNFIATPHLGAATKEAQVQVAIDMCQQIIDTLKGKMVRNACNIPSVDPEVLSRIAPYLALAEKLGRFQSQVNESRIEEIHVRYSGEVTNYNVAPISVAVLKGYLEPILQSSINYVNAPFIAKERGIRMVESKSSDTEDYASMITVTVRCKEHERIVSGTLFGKKETRIVRIDDYRLDCIPSGFILVLMNEDVPGIVGHVGTVLAEHNINIAGMALGRLEKGGKALTALNVDEDVEDNVLADLKKLPHILEARVVDLSK